MTEINWQQVRDIFEAALAQNPAERDAFLAAACADEPEVLAEVRNLLRAYEQAGSFIERPMMDSPAETDTFRPPPTLIGRPIGHWQILRALGSGGMGQVYLAARADGEFQKKVAIKLLPTGAGQAMVARFRRERQVLADLEHPNIARLLDGGTTDDGAPYVVMEYVEGRSLRQVLQAEGALPLKRIVEIVRQICAALGAAHEAGVLHRDIKPENIIVTESGGTMQVKVLDFGLAKLIAPEADENKTQTGIVMGTAAYMSPEQAGGLSGVKIDHRTDIYSLGMMVYEMLTGQVAFRGETFMEVLHKHLYEKPLPPGQVRPELNLSPEVERVVLRALEKERSARQQTAGEFAAQLTAASTASSTIASAAATVAVPAAMQRKKYERLLWGVVGLVLGAIMVGITSWLLAARPASHSTSSQAVKRMTVRLLNDEPLAFTKPGNDGHGRTSVAISPDGRLLVYAGLHNGNSLLYARALDQFDAKPIPGTEGAYDPFFSPDGKQVGFFARGKLKRVLLQGGEPVTLCEVRVPYGASWGPDDTIVFANSEGGNLSRIPASGGKPQVLFSNALYYPQFLPNSKAVLFSIQGNSPDYSRIAVFLLATGESKVLIEGGTNPRYAASGHLLFARAGGVLAAPFDLSTLEVTGPAVTIIEGVRIEEWGAAQFALSTEGTLIYANGSSAYIGKPAWVDRQGISKPLAMPAQAYGLPRLSPDGSRLAISVVGLTSDVWVYEFARGTFTRLMAEGDVSSPLWTPDGKRITYNRSSGSNQSEIIWKLADGSGTEEVLTTGQYWRAPESWAPDGKLFAFSVWNNEGADLGIFLLEDKGKPQVWLKTKFNEYGAAFSPDGRYIAYCSDESGQYEIYVRPYSDPGEKRQISTNGGDDVVWSPNGRELFYREGRKLMSVAIQFQPKFHAEVPRQLFEGPYLSVPGASYDVAPDGQRFLMIEEATKQPPITHLNVVLNWFEELKQRVPTKGN